MSPLSIAMSKQASLMGKCLHVKHAAAFKLLQKLAASSFGAFLRKALK